MRIVAFERDSATRTSGFEACLKVFVVGLSFHSAKSSLSSTCFLTCYNYSAASRHCSQSFHLLQRAAITTVHAANVSSLQESFLQDQVSSASCDELPFLLLSATAASIGSSPWAPSSHSPCSLLALWTSSSRPSWTSRDEALSPAPAGLATRFERSASSYLQVSAPVHQFAPWLPPWASAVQLPNSAFHDHLDYFWSPESSLWRSTSQHWFKVPLLQLACLSAAEVEIGLLHLMLFHSSSITWHRIPALRPEPPTHCSLQPCLGTRPPALPSFQISQATCQLSVCLSPYSWRSSSPLSGAGRRLGPLISSD